MGARVLDTGDVSTDKINGHASVYIKTRQKRLYAYAFVARDSILFVPAWICTWPRYLQFMSAVQAELISVTTAPGQAEWAPVIPRESSTLSCCCNRKRCQRGPPSGCVCFYHSFSLYSFTKPGHLPSPFLSLLFAFYFSFFPFIFVLHRYILVDRGSANYPKHGPIFIFYWVAIGRNSSFHLGKR